jgi:cytochrome b subunit of formate dehydrogenase
MNNAPTPRSRVGLWIGIVTVIVILIGGVVMYRNGHYGWANHAITTGKAGK